MTLNQMVDAIMVRMSSDEQNLLAWLSRNHAAHRLTHVWRRVARWVIEYRDSNGKPKRSKPLTPKQFRRLRVLATRSEMFSVSSPKIAVIKVRHGGHAYVYAYKPPRIGRIYELWRASANS
jgi:hypothetical protein